MVETASTGDFTNQVEVEDKTSELPTVKRSTAMTGASRFTRNRVRQDRNLATTTYIPSTGSST
ncbi:hypothetical protein, partial [Tychonema sp. LEGE 06208]|uniref:hypothetical protein n=1 Tax=Tychonema sp. LEGE 06208 TaxID=1828663 RepID=UPI0019FEAC13